ncbi:DUF2800 domain-containing protein [Verrucomicrobia bacterium]|nr:DUF2800 domain-containing protein [Verrucomicrobiota bacterium]
MSNTQALVEVPEQWPESAEEMGRLMQAAEQAESLCKMIRQAVKDRLDSDRPVDGWTLRRGNIRKEITDIQGLYRELQQAHSITADEFLKCCTVNQTKLSSLFQFKGPQGSLIDNKQALKSVCKPYTTEKIGSSVLKKKEGQ